MFKKLAFAAILGASYPATAEAAGSCLAKDDNAWAAIGLTVTTNTATDVSGLNAIGAAAGWHESSSGSANAVCAGGAAVAALASAAGKSITTGTAGSASSTPTGGTGTGLVADVVVAAGATTLTSITVTTAGTGYAVGDVLTFPAETGGTGDHAPFTYTLVAGDFVIAYDAFAYTLKAADFTAGQTCDQKGGIDVPAVTAEASCPKIANSGGNRRLASGRNLLVLTGSLSERVAKIVAKVQPVAKAAGTEAAARAHTLAYEWDDHVDRTLAAVGERREEALVRMKRAGAYISYHYFRQHYHYANYYEYESASNNEARATLKSSSNQALVRHGGAVMVQSAIAVFTGKTQILNSQAHWGHGGGINCISSSLAVRGGTKMWFNRALEGGAIYTEECTTEVRDPDTSFWENTAFRNGGAMFLGELTSTTVSDATFRSNRADCPVILGETDCPEWRDTITDDGVDSFCIHPNCKNYLTKGGAVFAQRATDFTTRHTTYDKNSATSGGAIFTEDMLDFVSLKSTFTKNSAKRTIGLSEAGSFFRSNGGAVYIRLSKNTRLIAQPELADTMFYDNAADEGSGGAIYWEVPPNMFPQVGTVGGLVKLSGAYEQQTTQMPLAANNTGEWGGDFIASCPYGLVTIQGPARDSGATTTTSVECDHLKETGLCPYRCSGKDASVQGQQCIARANTPTQARTANVRGGVPIEETVGVQELKVAVVDFYNHVVEVTGEEPILVEVAVDYVDAGLGLAFTGVRDCDESVPGDCDTQDGSENVELETSCTGAPWGKAFPLYPRVCKFLLSPESRLTQVHPQDSMAASIPDRGIATFPGLAIHGPPSGLMFQSPNPSAAVPGMPKELTLQTPKRYDLVIIAKGLVGHPEVSKQGVSQPPTAVTVQNCPEGTWLDRTPTSMKCKACAPGRYANTLNYNLDGSAQNDPCIQCPAGQFQSDAGQTVCNDCAVGTYASEVGTVKCKPCENGTHTASGLPGGSACQGCPAGKYGLLAGIPGAHYSVCSECPAGRSQMYSHEKFTRVVENAKACWNWSNGTAEAPPETFWQKPFDDVSLASFRAKEKFPEDKDDPRQGLDLYKLNSSGVMTDEVLTRAKFAERAETKKVANVHTCLARLLDSIETQPFTWSGYAPLRQFLAAEIQRADEASIAAVGAYLGLEASEIKRPRLVSFFDVEMEKAKVKDPLWDCATCPMGYMQPQIGELECSACDEGLTSTEESMSCELGCEMGTYHLGQGKIGYKYPALKSGQKRTPQMLCVKCPKGYIAPLAEAATCEKCPAGFYNDIVGLPVGTDDVKEECNMCPMGFSTKREATVVCEECAAGKYNRAEGSTLCKECEVGLYNQRISRDAERAYLHDGTQWLRKLWEHEIVKEPVVVPPPSAKTGADEAEAEKKALVDSWWDNSRWVACPECGNDADNLREGLTKIVTVGSEAFAKPRNFTTTDQKWVFNASIMKKHKVSFKWDGPPADGTECEVCEMGAWAGEMTGADTCEQCPSGWIGEQNMDPDRPEGMQTFSECNTCPPNSITDAPGSVKCRTCPDKSWTKLANGQIECTACMRGEIFPSEGNSDRNCDTCPGFDKTAIGDRGTYSFVAGGDKCHECAPGTICHGGDEMSSEWGWWTARGRHDHIRYLKQVYAEKAENELLRPLNFDDCASIYAFDVDMPPETLHGQLNHVFLKDYANFSNNTWKPFECGDKCTTGDPGCECRYNSQGVEECKFWCDGGDELRGGLYMDKCGLLRKVTRCPGFQQLISCERSFKEQMIELLDNKHSRSKISIAAQCMACRSNSIVNVARGTFPVEVELFLTKKIAMATVPNAYLEIIRRGGGNLNSSASGTTASPENSSKIGVDVMWLFDGKGDLEGGESALGLKTMWDTYEYTKKDEWDLVFVTYRMPRAGKWDTNYYESMFGSFLMTKEEAQAQLSEMGEITVALLPNDPRLRSIEEHLASENAHRGRKSTWKTNNVNSRGGGGGGNASLVGNFGDNHPTSDAFSGATRCNVMFGYTGRLCRECTAGFTMTKKECVRCGSYDVVMGAAIAGSFLGLIIVMFVVLMVVHDAGSSSTSTVMKRILINHLQTVALLMNFDLNWTPNLMSAFEFASAVSSVGDDLIQVGCPLSALHHQCKSDPSSCSLPMDSEDEPMRPFYVGQMFFFFMPVIFMIPGAIYMVISHFICHAKLVALEAKEARDEDVQRRIADLKNIRSKQLKAQQTETGRKNFEETRKLRTEYNMLLAELHKNGYDDVEALAGVVADHHAIGRLRARDFVQHCNRNHVHLEDLFRGFDPDHTGSIPVSDFMLIVDNTLGEGVWSEEDKLCVSELFAGDHDDDPETEDRVELIRLLSFGKTLKDRLIVMAVTVCFLVYPTIGKLLLV